MHRLLPLIAAVALMVACQSSGSGPEKPVHFWRPISEPNLLLAQDKLQGKLGFDLGQCHCGIYPANATRDDVIDFQKDHQRLAQTGVTVAPDEDGQCLQKPSLVVTECMRQRGWEPTNCSGRVSTPGGGSLCASYSEPADQ
jgi:hypothetical protein